MKVSAHFNNRIKVPHTQTIPSAEFRVLSITKEPLLSSAAVQVVCSANTCGECSIPAMQYVVSRIQNECFPPYKQKSKLLSWVVRHAAVGCYRII